MSSGTREIVKVEPSVKFEHSPITNNPAKAGRQ